MSERQESRMRVLEAELETVQMMRRRAKDRPTDAIAAGERELEIQKLIDELKEDAA